ncbi:MAG: hypothetical protein VKL42_08185 [Snowella sp.]|nr:hypothetical protein [Snowella sp.]
MAKLIKVAGIAQVELERAKVEAKPKKATIIEVAKNKIAIPFFKTLIIDQQSPSFTAYGAAMSAILKFHITLARIKAVVEYLEIAIDSLTGKPNLILAQKLRYASETRLRKIQGGLRNDLANLGDDLFHSIKTPTKVLTGAVSAFPISWLIIYGIPISIPGTSINLTSPVQNILKSLPLPEVPRANQVYNIANQAYSQEVQVLNFISSSQNTKEKNQDTLNFVIALLMTGTLGGAVSIFLRIKEFDNSATQKYEDDLLPFLIGLLKPILGGSFAFFIFLLLNSGVSPVQIKGQGSNYLYGFLAFAFIAGFSERFVPDLISQTEKNLTQSQSQGLPIELKIDPQNISLVSEQKQTFKLNQILSADDYSVTLNPPNMGKCEKSQSQFDYSAPKKEGTTPSLVIITVTKNIDPKQTAQTTVILI